MPAFSTIEETADRLQKLGHNVRIIMKERVRYKMATKNASKNSAKETTAKATVKATPKAKAKAAPAKKPAAAEAKRGYALTDAQKIEITMFFDAQKKANVKVSEAIEALKKAHKDVKDAPDANLRAYYYAAGTRLTIAKNGKTIKLMEHVNGKDKVRAEVTK